MFALGLAAQSEDRGSNPASITDAVVDSSHWYHTLYVMGVVCFS